MTTGGYESRALEQRILHLLDLRRYVEAEAAARRLLVSEPHSSTAHRLVAQAALGQGRPAAGVRHAQSACELDPEDAWALITLSSCRRGVGHQGAAIEAAERAVQLAPHLWSTHYALAHAHVSGGGFFGARVAVESLDEASRLAPGLASIHNLRGLALQQMGREDQARAAYQEALRLNPHDAHALNNLGALDARRRPMRAAGPVTAAAGLDPQEPIFRGNVGIVAGNILTRLMRVLLWAGFVLVASRVLLVPLALRVVLVVLLLAVLIVGLARASRGLPRGMRRSPRSLWSALTPRARSTLKRSAVFLTLDIVIALAPLALAVLAGVVFVTIRVTMVAQRWPGSVGP